MNNWTEVSAIISDLDGVIYRGDDPIPSAAAAFRKWRKLGLPYAFVTNNSTKSAQEVSDKLNGMGIATSPEEIVTSSDATAERVASAVPKGGRVYVIGAPALMAAVAAKGFEIAATDPAAVVVGLDRDFSFSKLAKAQEAILGGAAFFGSNPDRMLPKGAGFEPGAGSILAAIETASGVTPTIIGKPQPYLVRVALERLGTPDDRTFMLGDQIETDIAAGHAAGLKTILVRTGVPPKAVTGIVPNFDIQSLAEIAVSADLNRRSGHG